MLFPSLLSDTGRAVIQDFRGRLVALLIEEEGKMNESFVMKRIEIKRLQGAVRFHRQAFVRDEQPAIHQMHVGLDAAKALIERIEKGQIDPSYIISHRISLDEAPDMYKLWRDKEDRVTKIVIDPWVEGKAA